MKLTYSEIKVIMRALASAGFHFETATEHSKRINECREALKLMQAKLPQPPKPLTVKKRWPVEFENSELGDDG